MRYLLFAAFASLALVQSPAITADTPTSNDLVLVVMDPLAADLSCPCVKGYAQRDYAKLATFLGKQLDRPVKLHFSESLAAALTRKTSGKADIIIGKDSVVAASAKANKLDIVGLAALTGKDGKTTQTGLWVVADKDPAVTVGDLKTHDLLFGNADAAEKSSAAIALLKDLEVPIPTTLATCNSCTDAAVKVLEAHKAGKKCAAVISSYAQPLLEGCGTVKKGELRVIGETDPVPFVTVSANASLSAKDREAIQKAFLAVAKDAALCKAMETKSGFVLPTTAKKK